MGRKILLIDDSAMLRRIATNVLHGGPGRYDVLTASRAAEGFALACIGGVDLILLDYLLGGLDDAQLCRRLQADARTARVPTILMVGQGVRAPALTTLPANVVDTLAKPFAPDQLSGVVNTLFSVSRTSTTLKELRANLHPDLAASDSLEVPLPATLRSPDEPTPLALSDTVATREHSPAMISSSDEGKVLLKGTTATTSLCNVMQTVAAGDYSGVLRLWAGPGEPTEVLFDQGQIVAVTTRDVEAYANRAADVLPTKVSPATLEEAVAEQKATGTPFLLNLGVRGLLSKSSAVALLYRFGQRQFSRIWPQRAREPVRFEFRCLNTLPQYLLRLEPSQVSLERWLLETTRTLRMEDIAGNLRHEGSVGTPWFQADGEANARKLELAEDERAFLRLATGRMDLPTIAKALGISQEIAYLILFRFRCLDILSYRTAPAAYVMTPRNNLRRVLPLKR